MAIAKGIKDAQTGLVRGYSYNELYSQVLGDGTVGWPGAFCFDWYDAMTWGVADYESTSNSLFSRNDEWRPPTTDEVRPAAEAGPFSQHSYATGWQVMGEYWSATATNSGQKPKYSYYYQVLNGIPGYSGVTFANSSRDFIPVYAAQ